MSSPPVKDLYELLGKKLKEKEKKASQQAESKLRNFYSDELNKSYFKSLEIKNRFLQLQNSKYIDTKKLFIKIQNKPKLFGKKDYFQSLSLVLLSFCISWTRIEGKPFLLTDQTLQQFHDLYPSWKKSSYQELSQILSLLVESQLAIGDNVNGYWFEDQNDSNELRSILLLSDEKGMISISVIKEKLKWNDDKIKKLLSILVSQEIIIADNDNTDIFWILGS